ncbi:MAG: type II toxin-antitoxin system RelE/ParE family toxin [Candidatus Sumerlaeota bacterium]|nr:type II toxin-antitoxin system RelE/ParE family toxin [Candidatus Sumerlaeota bacterium]
MKPAVFHSEAEAEFRAAIHYYDEQRSGLGAEFQEVIEQAVAQIVEMPQAFPPHGDQGLRMYVVRRFPYTIFYLELGDLIWIAAVAHQRRRPGYWAHRRP